MPTFKHGKNAQFELEGTNLSNTLNEITLPREVETAETTAFGDQDKTYITGLSDATVSLSNVRFHDRLGYRNHHQQLEVRQHRLGFLHLRPERIGWI